MVISEDVVPIFGSLHFPCHLGVFLPGARVHTPIRWLLGTYLRAFEATTCAGGIYHVIEEVARVYVSPWHQDSAVHVQEVAFGGFEDYICLLNGTEVKASVAIPLREETAEQPVVDGRSCTDLVVAVGNDEEWLVETGYAGGDSLVFISPILPQAAGWASPGAWLSFSAFVWDLFPPLLTYCQMLLKGWVARLLVVDCGSSSPDLLSSSYTSSGPSALPLEREVDGVFIHHMVEEAISRLERQRVVAVPPELQCILRSWTARPQGAGETLTNPVPVVSPVAVNQSPAHQPWQRWALVVYRPGDHNVVYHNVCILLARWRQTVDMTVPVRVGEETVPAIEDTAAREEPPRKKNRPSPAARKRRAKRRERERQEKEGEDQ
ncbi:hypothetical protein V8E54_008444 [Elaphomyces granulatus]